MKRKKIRVHCNYFVFAIALPIYSHNARSPIPRLAVSTPWCGLNLRYLLMWLCERRSLLISEQTQFWCGNIQIGIIRDSSFKVNTGIISCGIICSNLSERSLSICNQLGRELEQIYKTAKIGGNFNGAIQYQSLVL
ncbi:hypothetical protein [Rivularia sp. UHCC 0363]|uniref:hypothetical protein n=1 Tax=Rivularia sp. UHCC 0363 TaxID=3110244 RepID=UPI002B1ECA0F|nr:hypothetical protein [Rivularia sp. UHCC 0363]MEA5597141.1 hypothetical protein [Rivularia sp. UHCC 0363]